MSLDGPSSARGVGGPSSSSEDVRKPPIYSGSMFDPGGMEAAAERALGLARSRNAKHEVATIRNEEQSRRQQMTQQVSAAQAEASELKKRHKRAEKEARNELANARQKAGKEVNEFRHDHQRKQNEELQKMQAKAKEEESQRQYTLLEEQEVIQAETLRLESVLREATDMAVIKARTEGNIKAERANSEQHRNLIKVRAAERRETVLGSITTGLSSVGGGLFSFMDDHERLAAMVLTVSTIGLGIYSAKVGTGVAGRFVESRLGKPALIRETSRPHGVGKKVVEPLRNALAALRGKPATADGMTSPALAAFMKTVILDPAVEVRLKNVAISTQNTKRNKAPFRHLLLYGPPGTGKTLFAKGLAKYSGMDYAILTGGDVAPLGRDAVTEIHKVFEWAQSSRKGLLLFVDESDAFLRRRATEAMSEDLRNALNAFLFRTGEASDKFMVVYASNQPEQFDWAINDRIDEMIEFKLPNAKERMRMLAYYMKKLMVEADEGNDDSLLMPGIKPAKITVDESINSVDEMGVLLKRVAGRLKGFSGRAISKLATAWQAAAYGSNPPQLNRALMEEVLEQFIEQRAIMDAWGGIESEIYRSQVQLGDFTCTTAEKTEPQLAK